MIDSEEKFPLGVLDFYVENKDLDNIHMLKKFWNEKYWPEYEESKKLQQRIDKAIEYILDGRYGEDDDYESISLYIPKLLEILRGKDENN
jgi:hypothetical protein